MILPFPAQNIKFWKGFGVLTTYSAMVSRPSTTSAKFPAETQALQIQTNTSKYTNAIKKKKAQQRGHDGTFGIREDDRHHGCSPVGDLHGEVPLPEHVLADRLPRTGAAGERGGHHHHHKAQERERQPSSSHCEQSDSSWATHRTRGEGCMQLILDGLLI